MQKIKRFLVVLMVLVAAFCLPVGATETGKSYVYDHNKDAMKTPDPYSVEAVMNGSDYGWKNPVDLQGKDGLLYILDSTGSVFVVDATTYEQRSVITFTKDGQPYLTEEPRCLWIDSDGTFLVVDRSKKTVFRATGEGLVIKEYGKPDTDLIDETSDYLPYQVVTDYLGNIYIMAENQYRGIFKLTREGEFITFYGSKSVEVTASLMLDMLWRNFMTEAQIDNSSRYLPTGYNSMAVDEEGFIYATSANSSDRSEWVVKMNSLGNNTLDGPAEYGDFNLLSIRGSGSGSNFCSITVDQSGYITVLDESWNRLFQYSQEGELLYVFGGLGEQEGTFGEPSCVRSVGDKLLVCDGVYGSVTVLSLTEFGATVREADALYQAGLFAESAVCWEELLQSCQNYEYAYIGIGKAEYTQKNYKKAMEYFRLGYAVKEYSMAFERYRAQIMREAFAPMIIALAVIIIALIAGKKLRLRYGKVKRDKENSRFVRFRYMWYSLLHPIEAFGELRYNKMGSVPLATTVILLYFAMSCLSFSLRGFIFNSNEPSDFNIFVILATTVCVVLVFCLVNWLLAVFFEGKGRFKEIWITVGYSLIPMLIASVADLIMSQFLTLDEAAFLTYVTVIGVLWTAVVFVLGLKEIHQYSFSRNLLSLAVSVFGILIVLFLIFLVISLYVQVSEFITTVYEELMYRSQAGF